MANVQMGGFRVWGTVTGGEGAFPASFVSELASGYATAIGIGDVIIPVTDGTVARAAATDNGKLLGVVTGCSYVAGGITVGRSLSNYIPASTTFSPSTVGSANASLVQWVPATSEVIFAVQASAAFSTPTAPGIIGLIGKNVDLLVGTADSVTGVSGFSIDLSTQATSTLNFRIIGIKGYTLQGGFSTLDNDPTLTRFEFLVVNNEGV